VGFCACFFSLFKFDALLIPGIINSLYSGYYMLARPDHLIKKNSNDISIITVLDIIFTECRVVSLQK
jgi:hypothetical protein